MDGILLPACSIVFSLLLLIVYFVKEKVPLVQNKVYSGMLIVSFIDSICVTFLQSLGFNGVTNFELILVKFVNRIDFCLLLFYVTFLLIYTLFITIDKFKNNYKKYITMFMAFNIIAMIVISSLNVELISIGDNYSISGAATMTTYVICGLYLVASILVVLCNLNKVDKRHIPILSIIVIVGLLMLLFKINPYLIVISVTLTFINYLMYFTIENPDVRIAELEKQAKNAAIQASHAKSEFLSSMSHELRTPLNAIVGLSEDIQSFKEEVHPEVREDSDDIINASNTLLEIIGSILDISKIESGKLEIVETDYDPKEEFESLTKIMRTKVAEKPLEFDVLIDPNLPKVLYGDRLRIKQVVNNLLSNAIKYTNRGKVTFKVRWLDFSKTMIIEVADTGTGIKPEDKDKLFGKFERLQVEKVSSVQGTGLGLSITKNLVELMGGQIDVESEYGKGSIFRVLIPQKIGSLENLEKLKAQSAYNNITIDLSGKKILIVDDNEINIKVLKKAIKNYGFEIDECFDGRQALEKINSGNQYDLVLMDIMMPDMGGEETIGVLRKNSEFKTPVVALTADAMTGAKEKYIGMGFNDYLAKPFTREVVAQKLNGIFMDKNHNQVNISVEITNTSNEEENKEKGDEYDGIL